MKFESLQKAKEAFSALGEKIKAACSDELPKSLDAAKSAISALTENLTAAQEHADGALALAEDLGAQLKAAQADQKAAEELATEAGQKQADAEAALKTEKARAEAAETKVTHLESEQKTVEAEVARICAAAGVDPVTAETKTGGEGSLTEQYNAIKDPSAKAEFLAKHKTELFKEQTKKGE